MAAATNLAVEKRAGLGKENNRQLRETGMVPGVYYDAKGTNIPIMMNEMALDRAFQAVGRNQLLDLEIKGDSGPSSHKVLIWDLQRHPFKNRYLHVDFRGVDMDSRVKVTVPLEITGVSKGVKNAGGRMDILREKVEVMSLPGDIPAVIKIDVAGLDINDSIHVEDLDLPASVEVLRDDNFAIVHVYLPGKGDKEGEGEEGEGAED